MRRIVGSAAVIAVTLLPGCGSSDESLESVCPGLSRSAMRIYVVDAATKAPVRNPTGLAVDGPESITLSVSENMLYGPENRFAVYSLIVSAPGYVTWTAQGVDTTKLYGGCPATLEFTVELAPS